MALAGQILDEEQMKQFTQNWDIDLAYSCPGVARFRINIYRKSGSIALALRALNYEIPPLESLGLPKMVAELARRQKGLILTTGPTGSGKTTTQAALIDLINQQRSCHILTLEDPIEYIHHNKNSIINQREVGHDSLSFARGLRAALRQDPDVILVGEMRDLETISIAITAAETGQLVLATLHTVDAAQTIDRVIDIFPPHQQQQVRIQLANNLVAIIAQRLLRCRDGQGRVPAVELLISTPAVRNLIREGKIHQIYSVLQTGSRHGMQLLDAHLEELCRRSLIDHRTALDNATEPEILAKSLGGGAARTDHEAPGFPGAAERYDRSILPGPRTPLETARGAGGKPPEYS